MLCPPKVDWAHTPMASYRGVARNLLRWGTKQRFGGRKSTSGAQGLMPLGVLKAEDICAYYCSNVLTKKTNFQRDNYRGTCPAPPSLRPWRRRRTLCIELFTTTTDDLVEKLKTKHVELSRVGRCVLTRRQSWSSFQFSSQLDWINSQHIQFSMFRPNPSWTSWGFNTHHRRDSTVQLSCVGGVYWFRLFIRFVLSLLSFVYDLSERQVAETRKFSWGVGQLHYL